MEIQKKEILKTLKEKKKEIINYFWKDLPEGRIHSTLMVVCVWAEFIW